jgi:hypothetical protein
MAPRCGRWDYVPSKYRCEKRNGIEKIYKTLKKETNTTLKITIGETQGLGDTS